jgi:membrane-bound metal-dependent hydrolase YbcI (DUF457 family)
VDPIAHVALGRVVGTLGRPHLLRRTSGPIGTRGLTAAFVLGSLSPDIDFVAMPFGWDRYLLWHEFVTHSLVGTVIPAVVTALLIVAALRRERAPFGTLAAAAWIGALSHLLLDLVSGGTSLVLWPMLTARVSLPLAGMADPLLGVPLGVFLVGSLVRRSAAPRLAAGALIVLIAVMAIKGVSFVVAHQVVRAQIGASGPQRLEARWGSVRSWRFFDRDAHTLRAWDVTVWPHATTLAFARPVPAETREAVSSRRFETVSHFEAVFDLAFHQQTRHAGRTTVLWSDIRLCDADGCALWFGGELDATGRPLSQVVLVGDWRQTRAP